jgi:hypothetical protein
MTPKGKYLAIAMSDAFAAVFALHRNPLWFRQHDPLVLLWISVPRPPDLNFNGDQSSAQHTILTISSKYRLNQIQGRTAMWGGGKRETKEV